MTFFDDLKQRKLFQWAVAYLAGAWVLMQLIDVLGSRWGVSDSTARIIDIVLVVGFFVTLVVAWYHGDQGRQRVSGPELLIIAALFAVGGLALGILSIDKKPPSPLDPPVGESVSSDETPWIAVLPFKVQTADSDLENFADGLTEDISNGLSDFSYLLVLSRNAVSGLTAESIDVRQIGKELGARYVLQGALRKAGSTTRITAQLVDAQNGTQIWAETFDRELSGSGILAMQDEITDRIVATVADPAGVVVRTLAAPADRKAPGDLTPYEAVLRYFLFQQRISADDHLITRTALERAVELDPGYADGWNSLSLIYQQEFMNNLNPQPDSLERALVAGQRAVDLDPASSRAHFALAQARYFLRDVGAFLVHAERAIELNPRNTDTMAMVGIMMGYAGDWERSVELTTRAMALNPQHAGWYYFNTFFNEYRQGRYSEALTIAQKINLPDYWASPMALAISHAQLGHEAAARSAADDLLRIWPTFEQDYYQLGLVNWMYAQPELVELINEGLYKAGIHLKVPDTTIR
jgi:TolB-like protein/tetratricopeptide (TPR) repeat protein